MLPAGQSGASPPQGPQKTRIVLLQGSPPDRPVVPWDVPSRQRAARPVLESINGQALGARQQQAGPAYISPHGPCRGRCRYARGGRLYSQSFRRPGRACPVGRSGGPDRDSRWRGIHGCVRRRRLPAGRQYWSAGLGPGWCRVPSSSGHRFGPECHPGFSACSAGRVPGPFGRHCTRTGRNRPAARRLPDGAARVAEPELALRFPGQPPQWHVGRLPPWPGLCGRLRNPRLRGRLRGGPRCGVASLGRGQPGGNRSR